MRRAKVAAVLALTATGAWYLFSRLVWGPVPWPDGSAFYLPSIELLAWPPHWRMHAQAAFVPSYDQANFNLMPALPLILGVATRWLGLGRWLGAPLAIRVASMPALLLWAWVLWRWTARALEDRGGLAARRALAIATLVGGAALWDPIVRWGTLVVRTETWIGLAWLLCLRELHRLEALPVPGGPGSAGSANARARGHALWKISAALAMAAYFHFEAAYLVPAAAIGLIPAAASAESARPLAREWGTRLGGVAWRTLTLLSPWLLYVALNWNLFVEQMGVQFHRLGHENRLIANAYLTFHSLFLSLGSPEFTPKIFNVAKAAFWAILILLTARTAFGGLRQLERAARREQRGLGSPSTLAAAVAFWTTFYLWCTKPEVWFTTLCHLTLWPWLAALLIALSERRRVTSDPGLGRSSERALLALTAVYGVLALGSGVFQQLKTPGYYSWRTYRAWVDCIETVASQTAVAHVGGQPRVWQPHVPDVLVELSQRSEHYDLTRALDFEARRPLAEEFGRKADVLIFSRWFNLSPDDPLYTPPDGHEVLSYEGPERPADIEKMRDHVEVPFGPWALEKLPVLEPGVYQAEVCQVGPFWSDLRVRVGQ